MSTPTDDIATDLGSLIYEAIGVVDLPCPVEVTFAIPKSTPAEGVLTAIVVSDNPDQILFLTLVKGGAAYVIPWHAVSGLRALP